MIAICMDCSKICVNGPHKKKANGDNILSNNNAYILVCPKCDSSKLAFIEDDGKSIDSNEVNKDNYKIDSVDIDNDNDVIDNAFDDIEHVYPEEDVGVSSDALQSIPSDVLKFLSPEEINAVKNDEAAIKKANAERKQKPKITVDRGSSSEFIEVKCIRCNNKFVSNDNFPQMCPECDSYIKGKIGG